MFPFIELAEEVIETATNVIRKGDCAQLHALDVFPVALYVTDTNGFISYFNPACVDFAGRKPKLAQDRWCVTWKLYTDDGKFLPHDQCPMAVAIQSKHAIRGVTAVAERPNGTHFEFLPFPTPVLGDHGEMLGAVNLLIDLAGFHESTSKDLREHLRSWQLTLVERALATFTVEEIGKLIEEMELELGQQAPRNIH